MRLILGLLVLALATPAFAEGPQLDYDLRANAPAAHVYRDGVVADAGTIGFVKYIRDMNGKWKLGVKEAGRPAALMPGLQGNFWLPVGPELAGEKLVLEAMIHPFGDDQRMDPFVNGKKAGNVTLKDGWQTIRVPLEDGLATEGFNKVRLHFRRKVAKGGFESAGAVRFVRLVKASAPAAPEAEADVAGALEATQGEELVLPDGGGLDYYVTPAKGTSLRGTARGGTAELWAQLDGGKPERLGGGASLDLGLSKFAGKAVRLMLRGKGGHVKFKGGITGATSKPATIAKPKYVVFWLIDTLRADKLGFYDAPNPNGRKAKTPNLDALAKTATVFDPFYVQGNESKASHASLFTGTYPVTHGVYTEKANLRADHVTLAEAFKKAGYTTGGYCSNGYISDKWNFTQGFDSFTNFIRENKPNSAQSIVKAAKKYIDKNKDKSFYLYLGTSDPHVTYRRHKNFIDDYWKGPYNGGYEKSLSGAELGKLKGKKGGPSANDKKRIEALYENEIAFNDHWFGQLVEHLKAAGIYDDTMIIVSSDHGDEFWEHGSCGHGHNLHQELVRVPLLIHWPKGFPARKVTSGVDGVDLLPTITSMLGQPMPKDVQGEDLAPLLNGSNVYPRALMASMGTGSYALTSGPAKVIMRSESSIQVYDVNKDPGETDDIYPAKAVISQAALDPLALFLSNPKGWKKSTFGPPNNLTRAFK